MKIKYILGAALIMLIFLTGIAAAVPPASPPAPQNLGLGDTKFENVTTSTCKNCHPTPPDIHHAMVGGNANFGTPLGCQDCHPMTGPIGSQTMTISRVCQDCHNSANWTANPIVNLTRLRGAPGRPHHNITKASVSNIIDASYWAADRQCNNCHGTGIIADYNDGHVPPAYSLSLVTPFADFKLNSSWNGQEYGGCAVCHGDGSVSGVTINNNHDTHHYVKFWIGNQCNNCHVSSGARAEPVPDYNPEASANVLRVWFNASYPQYLRYGWDTSQRHVELRNSTILTAGDTVNGTGCQKCHSMESLHNIEFDSANSQANEIPGLGHIGNNSDCNGCHYGNALFLTDIAPGQGATVVSIGSLTPNIVSANVATNVAISGDNLVQTGYNSDVLVDGQVAASNVAEPIVINVNLAAGGHNVQVRKTNAANPADTTTSAIASIAAVAPPAITSAELASGVLTITGSGFGTDDMTSVTITKADGRQVLAATTSWSDTVIVANGADAAAGDSVTVLTKTGSATATITSPPTLTTITVEPPTATVKIRDTKVFTATALDQNGNPMSGITITWSSSNTWVGTVSPTSGITGSDGKVTTTFTASHKGTAIVSASSGSVSGSATVTV